MNTKMAAETGLENRVRADGWTVTRREVLTASGSVIIGLSLSAAVAGAESTKAKPIVRFGIVTDAHYADTATRGSRHYRESTDKLGECVALMNEKKVDFLIELGDLKDEGAPAAEADTLKYLKTIEAVFAKFDGPRFHVLGNHDVDSISKAQFLARVENTGIRKGSQYYSFDSGGLHFVVLDANYKADGTDYDHGNFNWTDTNIPDKQIDWLRKDLAAATQPTLVFVHQRLDGKGSHYVKNADAVRAVLEKSQRVLAVFQGHHHAGGHQRINEIHYYTLKAMVEGTGEKNNAYAIVEVQGNGDVIVTGYRKSVSMRMNRKQTKSD